MQTPIEPADTQEATTAELLDGFYLGGFLVLPREHKILRGDTPDEWQKVEPRHMDVLVALARKPKQVITREALLDDVWSNTIVTDQNLTAAISNLRNHLGEDRGLIRTLSKIGYELICDVTTLSETKEEREERSQKLIYLAVAVLAAVLVVAAGAWVWQESAQAPTSLAVIPFTASGAQNDGIIFGEGVATYLISALTRSPELSVVAERSTFVIRGRTMDIRTIGDLLDVDYLVEGSIAQRGEKLELTLTLVDADSQINLWTSTIEGTIGNTSELSARALAELSGGLSRKLGLGQLTAARTQAENPANPDAYLKYLEAKYMWSLRGTSRIGKAIDLLRDAITIQPEFAEAHLALARSMATEPFYTAKPVAAQFAMARQAAATARQLDESLANDVAALEGMMLMEEMQWAAAEARLRGAVDAAPDDPLAHYWYGSLLSRFGDFDAGLKHARKAAELHPVSAFINDRLALAYLWVNDDASATRQYAISRELGFLESTQVGPYVLHAVRTGQFEEIEMMLLAVDFSPAWVGPFVEGLEDPAKRPEATQAIEAAMAAGEIDRRYWFGIWVFFQDAERAFGAFHDQPKSQDLELLWAAETDFLRDDPRFADLLDRVGLSTYLTEETNGGL